MDACKYCKKYHYPLEICDDYIMWLAKQDDNIKKIVKRKTNKKG